MRRVFTGMIAVLLTAALTPAPAQARAAELTAKATLWQTTLGLDGKKEFAPLRGRLSATDDRPHDLVYSIEYADIESFAELELLDDWSDESCRATGTVISCAQQTFPGEDFLFLDTFSIHATPAATAGDSGEVVVTMRVDDGPETSGESLVRVGEPVNIAASGRVRAVAAPGTTTEINTAVRNAGSNPVDGSVLVFTFARSLITGTFRNCSYGILVICSFDTVMQPGRTYRLSSGVRIRIPTGAAGGSVISGETAVWLTRAAWEDAQTFFDNTGAVPGTGRPLRLVPLPGSAGVPQKDTEPDDDIARIDVGVTGVRPDLAAIGAKVTGSLGDEVTVEAGIVNHGPGTLRPDLFDNNAFATTVRLPGNLQVVDADDRCYVVDDEGTYHCEPEDRSFGRGAPELFTFTAKVVAESADDGEVSLTEPEEPLEYGKDKRNNTAAITVEVVTEGGGAGLPVTGPGGAAGLAGLLLAGGAGALLLTRRRRTPVTR